MNKQFASRHSVSADFGPIQTVCKGYQQTTNIAASKERVKKSYRYPGRPFLLSHKEHSENSSNCFFASATFVVC